MSYEIASVKGIIKELSARSSKSRARISRLTGAERHAARAAKAELGQITRVYLLAYALVRGLSYREVEPRTSLSAAQANDLSLAVFRVVEFFGRERRKRNEVKRWLEEPQRPLPQRTPEERERIAAAKRAKGEELRRLAGRAP